MLHHHLEAIFGTALAAVQGRRRLRRPLRVHIHRRDAEQSARILLRNQVYRRDAQWPRRHQLLQPRRRLAILTNMRHRAVCGDLDHLVRRARAQTGPNRLRELLRLVVKRGGPAPLRRADEARPLWRGPLVRKHTRLDEREPQRQGVGALREANRAVKRTVLLHIGGQGAQGEARVGVRVVLAAQLPSNAAEIDPGEAMRGSIGLLCVVGGSWRM